MPSSSLRYSRQELVLGKDQKKLLRSKVAIVGVGALGTVAAELLVRAGVSVTLVDRDMVELSNLQRQVLFTEADVGKEKAKVASTVLHKINSEVSLDYHVTDLNHRNVSLLDGHDLILDCTDNLYTRFLINDYTRKNRLPWVYAGAIKDHGMVMLITPSTPCFRCTVSETEGLDTCDTAGILNTASTVIAGLQVQFAIGYLCGRVEEKQKLHHIHLPTLRFSSITTKQDKTCPCCSGHYEYLDGSKEHRTLQYQCSDLYTFFLENIDFGSLQDRFRKLEGKVSKEYLMFKNITVFRNGRVLVRAPSLKNAKNDVSKYIGI